MESIRGTEFGVSMGRMEVQYCIKLIAVRAIQVIKCLWKISMQTSPAVVTKQDQG